VWDRFAPLYDAKKPKWRDIDAAWPVHVRGRVFDTRSLAPVLATEEARKHPGPVWLLNEAGNRETFHDLLLDGVVYTAIFCPMDGRKNWFDMICAFCWALRDMPDATLVLKLTHRDCDFAITEIAGPGLPRSRRRQHLHRQHLAWRRPVPAADGIHGGRQTGARPHP
jgi:hypothetical protein